MAEWLFDDHPCPAVVSFLGQAAFAQLLDDRREESRCDRQIEESVSERVLKLVSLFNLLFQPLVGLGVLKVSPDVINSLGDPVPELQVDRCGSVLGNLLAQHLAKAFRGVIVGGESHNGELLRKKVVLGEIAKRGKQFAFRQVAGYAKNNHHAGCCSRIRIGVVRDHRRNSLSSERQTTLEISKDRK